MSLRTNVVRTNVVRANVTSRKCRFAQMSLCANVTKLTEQEAGLSNSLCLAVALVAIIAMIFVTLSYATCDLTIQSVTLFISIFVIT